MGNPWCVMADYEGRGIVNLHADLVNGVGEAIAYRMIVEYIAMKFHIPRLVSEQVFRCLKETHTACSQGNRLCSLTLEG